MNLKCLEELLTEYQVKLLADEQFKQKNLQTNNFSNPRFIYFSQSSNNTRIIAKGSLSSLRPLPKRTAGNYKMQTANIQAPTHLQLFPLNITI